MLIKKTLVLPPWMNTIKFYNTNVSDFYVSSGVLEKNSYGVEYVVGVSLGALAVLEQATSIQGKVILINPPVPLKGLGFLATQWIKYITGGLYVERQKFTLNPYQWIVSLRRAYTLLTTDFSATIRAFPKERLVVIRSKGDRFFCTTEAVTYLREYGVVVVEVEGGHNWNKNTEDEMNRQLGEYRE